MKIHRLLLICSLFLVACEPVPEPEGLAESLNNAQEPHHSISINMEQPMPEQRPHEMTLHGDTRVDEYFWLRDDTREDPEVLAYLNEENAYFEKVMEPVVAMQETMLEEMTARLDPDESSVPYLKDGYWYYSRYEPES